MRFGALAIFIGSALEGEPFALAGGLLARRGTLPLWEALACAIDVFRFLLRRYCRAHRWVRAVAPVEPWPGATALGGCVLGLALLLAGLIRGDARRACRHPQALSAFGGFI